MNCNRVVASCLVMVWWIAAHGCEGAVAKPETREQAATLARLTNDRPPAVTANTNEVALACSANNGFAGDLYQQLSKEHPGENLFFSPFSISGALLIAAEGASAETADEMGKVLRFSKSLRTSGPDAASLPWQLTAIHKGQAAIYYRLSPEPISHELSEKITRLRSDLEVANHQTDILGQSDKRQEAERSEAAAQKLADELNLLLKQTDRYEWRAANALWGEKTYPFRSSFLDTIHAYYGGVALPVDFRNSAEVSRQKINDWVAQQTRDRIKDLMEPGTVSSDTRLVIINAVYFKGEWSEPFEESSTRPMKFHLADGTVVQTPTMSRYTHSAGYGGFNGDGTVLDTPREIPVDMPDTDPSLYPDARGATVLTLPYKGGMFLEIIVPQSPSGLGELEHRLFRVGLQHWIARFPDREVNSNIPKFKMETEYSLKESLQALGMVRAFNDPAQKDGAQFERMTAGDDPAKRLFVSVVCHRTFVEVNEKGTESVAATSVAMNVTAAAPFDRDQPKTRPFVPIFRADKPFLFAICDNVTHSVLFVGRMVKPQAP